MALQQGSLLEHGLAGQVQYQNKSSLPLNLQTSCLANGLAWEQSSKT
jgi:hypothetical protein